MTLMKDNSVISYNHEGDSEVMVMMKLIQVVMVMMVSVMIWKHVYQWAVKRRDYI